MSQPYPTWFQLLRIFNDRWFIEDEFRNHEQAWQTMLDDEYLRGIPTRLRQIDRAGNLIR